MHCSGNKMVENVSNKSSFDLISAWLAEEEGGVSLLSIAGFCCDISAFTPKFSRGLAGVCVSHRPGNFQYQIQG